MALPPRPLSLQELRDKHFELQREFDEHRIAVMFTIRDLEEKVDEVLGERTSQVQVSIDPKHGHYRAKLRDIPAWAIVVIVVAVCLTVVATCAQQPQKTSSGTSAVESFISSRLGW